MKFIDVHCHINADDYGDLDALLSRINSAGVEKIISVGFDLKSSEYCAQLAEKYACVYFTAGIHPTELKDYRPRDLQRIEELTAHKKCVAIGEIGLDYHYEDTDKPLQHEVFISQLEMAQRLNMPVQIHSRDCAEDMLKILGKYAPKLSGGALLHCYSHSVEIARELEGLGLYFSFGGSSTWSGAKRAKRVISALPLDRIMTETDSPYLAPKSRYGQFPNTPESIPEIAENIAQIKGITLEEVSKAVYANAHTLFKKLV